MNEGNQLQLILQDCTKNRIEELSEAVPENLKNVLLVMAQNGVLTRDWKVSAYIIPLGCFLHRKHFWSLWCGNLIVPESVILPCTVC